MFPVSGMLYAVCDMWYAVCDMWYEVCDMWYAVCGILYVASGQVFVNHHAAHSERVSRAVQGLLDMADGVSDMLHVTFDT